MKVFDYIYYKISKTYFKLDGRSGATGIAGVTIIQSLLLWDILFLLLKLLKVEDLTRFSKEIGVISTIVIVLIFVANIYRYKDRYNKLRFLWKDETETKSSIGGLFVFIALILPFFLFYLISKL